jgi:hypothetical protein
VSGVVSVCVCVCVSCGCECGTVCECGAAEIIRELCVRVPFLFEGTHPPAHVSGVWGDTIHIGNARPLYLFIVYCFCSWSLRILGKTMSVPSLNFTHSKCRLRRIKKVQFGVFSPELIVSFELKLS